MDHTFRLLGAFFPPDLSSPYLFALGQPLLETIGLTFAAMTLALLISLPLGIAVGARVRGAGWLVRGLSVFRAVPDLTLAILCVILFGIGTGAGMVALTLYYAAAMAKVFADLLAAAPRPPLVALEATGASRLQVAIYGRLPLAREDLASYFAFAFECALRASVIVGAVGGGGIGAELVGSLVAFDFQRASTLILLLVGIIAGFDRLMMWLRARPWRMLPLLPAGLVCAVAFGPGAFGLDHALGVIARMVPPSLPEEAWYGLPSLVWETVWMALAGTLGAALLGLAAALAAARGIAPWWLSFVARRLLEFLRTVPEVVWGLVLVAVSGVGPTAGPLALGVHSLGSLGRLFADALDNAASAPQEALAATGATRFMVAIYATIPLAGSAMLTHLLFRLEWNLRMATVLGLIGAGGIGQALYEAQQLFFYDRALAYVIVTAALILLVDKLSSLVRQRLHLAGRGRGAISRAGHEPSAFIRLLGRAS